MEDPFFPRDPNHVFALDTGEGTCRVEELARILRDSAQITPSRFTWITPHDFCGAVLRSHEQERACIIVDARTDEEAVGGSVPGAVRATSRLAPNELEQLVAHYRAGSRIVFFCLRSISRAPLAAQQLVHEIDQQQGQGGRSLRADITGADPHVSVLEGGFAALLQHLVRSLAGEDDVSLLAQLSLDELDHRLNPALVHRLIADSWSLKHTPDGPVVAHTTELKKWQSDGEETRQVEHLMEAEMSEELAYLVGQRMTLSPPAAGSMPYIS